MKCVTPATPSLGSQKDRQCSVIDTIKSQIPHSKPKAAQRSYNIHSTTKLIRENKQEKERYSSEEINEAVLEFNNGLSFRCGVIWVTGIL